MKKVCKGSSISNSSRPRYVHLDTCLEGAYCSHAILTTEIGVYHCPFGACFKKLENQKREVS